MVGRGKTANSPGRRVDGLALAQHRVEDFQRGLARSNAFAVDC
jgi:hypothetical protein